MIHHGFADAPFRVNMERVGFGGWRVGEKLRKGVEREEGGEAVVRM